MPSPVLDAIEAMLARNENAPALAAATTFLEQRGLSSEGRAGGLWLRSRAYEKCGQPRDAIADLEALGRMTPDNARVYSEMGILLTQVGEPRRAAEALARAVQLDPRQSRAWQNFGNTLRSIGERDAALRAFEAAVKVDPSYARAQASRGVVLEEMGRLKEAQEALELALKLDPQMLPALLSLGSLYSDIGDIDRATEFYVRATAVAPSDPGPWMQLGRLRADIDDLDGARAAYGNAASCDPDLLRAYLGRYLSLPSIYTDSADVQTQRTRYAAGLEELDEILPEIAAGISTERRLNGLRWSNFFLGYQGQDDRALQQRYGALVTRLLAPAAPLPPRPPGRTRLRVGFVSSFFRDSTVGRYFSSWIRDLHRRHFEVVVYHMYKTLDPLAQSLRANADLFRDCPRWTPAMMEAAIRADAPDILIYPELGMDAATFVLGALRLAPLQVAGWGHPVTTGFPAMDLFLSSEAMEIPGADAHYSEKLVRLPGLGTCYSMPLVPTDATREQFRLPVGVPLILCPQSHFKMMPEDDALIARVMAAVPEAVLVVFKGRNDVVWRRYLERLNAALLGAGVTGTKRVAVISVLPHVDYLRVNTLCDVMLDTARWSGGNTALDAIASGLPIVTMPGTLMRSRQTAGMYALMGLQGLTAASADDYVATAIRLLRDPAYRAAMAGEIIARRGAIFDDPKPVRALSEALLEQWHRR
jgi:CRISPR-associated protein Csy1